MVLDQFLFFVVVRLFLLALFIVFILVFLFNVFDFFFSGDTLFTEQELFFFHCCGHSWQMSRASGA